MRTKRWGVAIAALLVVAGLSWNFGSPYYTLWQMKRALEADDADALAAYIDFPALREDLKAELAAQMTSEAARQGDGMNGFALAFGTALLNPMIDNLVTPAGVRAMLANRPAGTETGPRLSGTAMPEQPNVARRGFSEFVVSPQNGPGGHLVFVRHGLGWKLSGFDLPPRPAGSPTS